MLLKLIKLRANSILVVFCFEIKTIFMQGSHSNDEMFILKLWAEIPEYCEFSDEGSEILQAVIPFSYPKSD